jgi:hypothetical protein
MKNDNVVFDNHSKLQEFQNGVRLLDCVKQPEIRDPSFQVIKVNLVFFISSFGRNATFFIFFKGASSI